MSEIFNQDITVINKVFDRTSKINSYKCTSIKGFWSSNKGITISDVDLVKSDGYKCYILSSVDGYVNPVSFDGTGWTLKNDDYIVKGIVSSISKIADLNSYEYMKITNIAVKDYGSSTMQHYEVSGA